MECAVRYLSAAAAGDPALWTVCGLCKGRISGAPAAKRGVEVLVGVTTFDD